MTGEQTYERRERGRVMPREAMPGKATPGDAMPRDEALMASWLSFCNIIRHRVRHVFWKRPDAVDRSGLGPGEIPPADILREIGAIIAQLEIVRTVAPGTELWRARWHPPHEPVVSAKALGTIPEALSTRSNRMSPAGIPMFYAATTPETARAEAAAVAAMPHATLTLGAFTVNRPATIVDFTELPPVPGSLDPAVGHLSQCMAFLHDFVDDLARAARPEFAEIDYVPTQVVTEFLLHAWEYAEPIDGIAYRSTQHDGQCVVLNVKSEHCLDRADHSGDADGPLTLTLAPETLRSGSAD